jgi:hypothetical protein
MLCFIKHRRPLTRVSQWCGGSPPARELKAPAPMCHHQWSLCVNGHVSQAGKQACRQASKHKAHTRTHKGDCRKHTHTHACASCRRRTSCPRGGEPGCLLVAHRAHTPRGLHTRTQTHTHTHTRLHAALPCGITHGCARFASRSAWAPVLARTDASTHTHTRAHGPCIHDTTAPQHLSACRRGQRTGSMQHAHQRHAAAPSTPIHVCRHHTTPPRDHHRQLLTGPVVTAHNRRPKTATAVRGAPLLPAALVHYSKPATLPKQPASMTAGTDSIAAAHTTHEHTPSEGRQASTPRACLRHHPIQHGLLPALELWAGNHVQG